MRHSRRRRIRRDIWNGLATIVLAAWSIAGPVAAQQRGRGIPAGPPQPTTGNHGVAGRVVDAETDRPIQGASVVVQRSGNQGPIGHPPITTGADGQFAVAGLPAGTFTLIATADGYARGFSSGVLINGITAAGERTEAQFVGGVEIRMWRAGVIEGTVTDDSGAPIAGATIEARQRSPRGRGAMFGVPRIATTDRAGAYRFDDLPPSDYLVAALFTPVTMPAASWEQLRRASPASTDGGDLIARVRASRLFVPTPTAARFGEYVFQVFSSEGPAPSPASKDAEGRPRLYPMTFYPSASSIREAKPVRVTAGEERKGIDFTLLAKPTVRVSGVVTAGGAPARHLGLRLVAPNDPPAEASEFTFPTNYEAATTFTDERGAFTFVGVPAGKYMITTAPPGGTPWVRSEVTVGTDDVSGLALTLRDGLSIRGRVVFAEDPPPPAATVSASPIAMLGALIGSDYGGSRAVEPDARGEFTTAPHAPGRYLVLNRPIGGWTLASAMLDGRDVSNVPFELVDRDLDGLVLTYTNRRPIVRGTVRVPPGRAADSVEVRAFPIEYRALIMEGMPSHLPVRQFQAATVSRSGTFSLLYMPPGEYFVVATFRQSTRDLGEALFDRLAPLATRVSVRAGEQQVIELTPVTMAPRGDRF